MEKHVTVVAPAYNHEQYIQECLWSVASQNCPGLELVVLDDCSKDGTVSAIQELLRNERFCASFPGGIQFIPHRKNAGAHSTINEGLERAGGEYVSVINTDDVFGENRLNLLLEACRKTGSALAFGGIRVIDGNGKPVCDGYGKAIMKYQDTALKCPTITMALTRGNSAISTGNMLFTRELYHRLGGFRKYRYVHDWDFVLRAALYTEPLFVPEALYYYRLHENNTISEISQNTEAANAVEGAGTKIAENPLTDFLQHILRGEYENTAIPEREVWEYFFQYKRYYSDDDAALWAWEKAKKERA